jgi:carboxylesterase
MATAKNGCLVVHGLTGTPATMASMQEALWSAGFCVAAPCLAGHGGTVDDLARVTWRDWYATVRAAYQELRREVDNVFCAGLSIGALLCLRLALEEGWGVRAMALLSTPLALPRFESVAMPLVRYSPLRWVIHTVNKDPTKSVADPDGQARYERLSLPQIPARAVFQLADLQRETRAAMHRIQNPIILLHGQQDAVAPPTNVEILRRAVASEVVEQVLFPKSKHVITMDYARRDAGKAAVDFFRRFA